MPRGRRNVSAFQQPARGMPARRCNGGRNHLRRGPPRTRIRGSGSERHRGCCWRVAAPDRHRRSWGSRRRRDRPAPSRRCECRARPGSARRHCRARRYSLRCAAWRSTRRRRPRSPGPAAPPATGRRCGRPGCRSHSAASRPVPPGIYAQSPSAAWSSETPAAPDSRGRSPCRQRRRCHSRGWRAAPRSRARQRSGRMGRNKAASRDWSRNPACPAGPRHPSGSRPAARTIRPSHRRKSAAGARRSPVRRSGAATRRRHCGDWQRHGCRPDSAPRNRHGSYRPRPAPRRWRGRRRAVARGYRRWCGHWRSRFRRPIRRPVSPPAPAPRFRSAVTATARRSSARP